MPQSGAISGLTVQGFVDYSRCGIAERYTEGS
jgi:hypothetical protein